MAKDVVVKLKLEREGMVKGLADVKSGFDMVYGAARAVVSAGMSLAQAYGAAMETGMKYSNTLKHNTIAIADARVSTKGLVDDLTLLKAANTAAEFRMGLTSKQFAVFAKAAVVQSQKLGISANKALEDLLTGTARGSRMILDNLGFIVKQGAGVVEVTEEINRKVGQQQAIVEGAAGEWAQLNIEFENLKNTVAKFLTESDFMEKVLGKLKEGVKGTTGFFKLLSGELDATTVEGYKTAKSMVAMADALGDNILGRKLQAIAGKFLDLSEALSATAREAERLKKSGMIAGMADGTIGASALGGGVAGEEALGLSKLDFELKKPDKKKKKKGRGDRGFESGVGPFGLGNAAEAEALAEAMERMVESADKIRQMQAEEARQRKPDMSFFGIDADKEIKTAQLKNEIMRDEERRIKSLAREYMKYGSSVLKGLDATTKLQVRFEAYKITMEGVREKMEDMATGAFQNFTAGIWASADAAIQGSESFGMAMAKMLKSTLMGIAAQSTVLAAFHFAKFVGSGFAAFWDLKAAGLYTAVAALAGGTALGMSAGGVGASSKRSSRSSSSSDRTNRPNFGARTSRSDKPQPINVNVYLGERNNPSAVLLAKQQASAAVMDRLATARMVTA